MVNERAAHSEAMHHTSVVFGHKNELSFGPDHREWPEEVVVSVSQH